MAPGAFAALIVAWAGLTSSGIAAQPLPALRIVHAAARVVVIPEPRSDVAVSLRQGRAGLPLPTVHRMGAVIVVDGALPPLDWRPGWLGGVGCGGSGAGARVYANGKAFAVGELPVVTARVPLDAVVMAEGALHGDIGPSGSLVLSARGCGDWRAAAAQRDLSITVRDSVSAHAASLFGVLKIDNSGRGEVVVDAGHARTATIRATSSGDVSYRGDTGGLDIFMRKTADVRLGKVFGKAAGDLATQGDLTYTRK